MPLFDYMQRLMQNRQSPFQQQGVLEYGGGYQQNNMMRGQEPFQMRGGSYYDEEEYDDEFDDEEDYDQPMRFGRGGMNRRRGMDRQQQDPTQFGRGNIDRIRSNRQEYRQQQRQELRQDRRQQRQDSRQEQRGMMGGQQEFNPQDHFGRALPDGSKNFNNRTNNILV